MQSPFDMPATRILYILPQPFLLPRGSSFRALATLDALTELGYAVDLLCYPIGPDPKGRKFRVFRCGRPPFLTAVKIGPSPRKLLFDAFLLRSATRMVKRNGYAVIHGVEEAGFIAAHLGRRFRIPYVYDMHSWMSQQIGDVNYLRSHFLLNCFKRLESSAMKRARAIITVGSEMTEILKGLVPGVRAYTLPDCALSLDALDTSKLQSTIRERFFRQSRKVILYTGNFHAYQGIDLLLRSIKELKAAANRSFDFCLLLVGGGPEDPKTVQRYKKMAADLGVEQEVVFSEAFPPEAMPSFMEQSDLVVSSRITGNNVPLKVYTYLASGTLLVATNVPSHVQVLSEDNCLLADPEPRALAGALYQGLVGISPQRRQELVAAAQRTGGVDQWRRFREIVKECYQECVNVKHRLLLLLVGSGVQEGANLPLVITL